MGLIWVKIVYFLKNSNLTVSYIKRDKNYFREPIFGLHLKSSTGLFLEFCIYINKRYPTEFYKHFFYPQTTGCFYPQFKKSQFGYTGHHIYFLPIFHVQEATRCVI